MHNLIYSSGTIKCHYCNQFLGVSSYFRFSHLLNGKSAAHRCADGFSRLILAQENPGECKLVVKKMYTSPFDLGLALMGHGIISASGNIMINITYLPDTIDEHCIFAVNTSDLNVYTYNKFGKYDLHTNSDRLLLFTEDDLS